MFLLTTHKPIVRSLQKNLYPRPCRINQVVATRSLLKAEVRYFPAKSKRSRLISCLIYGSSTLVLRAPLELPENNSLELATRNYKGPHKIKAANVVSTRDPMSQKICKQKRLTERLIVRERRF